MAGGGGGRGSNLECVIVICCGQSDQVTALCLCLYPCGSLVWSLSSPSPLPPALSCLHELQAGEELIKPDVSFEDLSDVKYIKQGNFVVGLVPRPPRLAQLQDAAQPTSSLNPPLGGHICSTVSQHFLGK
jgi:hypothetical protein